MCIRKICPTLSAAGKKRIYTRFRIEASHTREVREKKLSEDLDPTTIIELLDLTDDRVERLDQWLVASGFSSFKTSNEVCSRPDECMTCVNTCCV